MRLERHPNGPRLYIHGLRIHHGLTGTILTLLGIALIVDDRKDFPFLKDTQ